MKSNSIAKTLACLLLPAAAAAFITVGASPQAHALGDTCKNVKIKVINARPVQIKVTKIEYYDYDRGKWRSEAFVNRKISKTKSYTWNRNLEHVKNDKTKVRITYKDHLGGTRWGSARTETGGTHTCRAYQSLTFRAD